MTFKTQCDRIVKSIYFERVILGVLLLDLLVLCLEGLLPQAEPILKIVLEWILVILILDTVLRFGATIDQPKRYFKDVWNCFDLLILIGLIGLPDRFSYLALLRLPRFWRTTRILRGVGFGKFLLSAIKKRFF